MTRSPRGRVPGRMDEALVATAPAINLRKRQPAGRCARWCASPDSCGSAARSERNLPGIWLESRYRLGAVNTGWVSGS